MLMNLARGPIGEFVLVVRRNRIAEHQRVNDPDCTWLHCLPPLPDGPPQERSMHTPCQLLPSRGISTPRKRHTSTGKATLRTGSFRQAPALFGLNAAMTDGKISRKWEA